jgi:N-acetylglucosamine kinase-like BadF-type ATPase
LASKNKQLFLALDIGTSSVRAALYDDEGSVLPRTMVRNERTLTATDDGGAEIDADEAFDQVVQAIDDVLAKSKKIKGEITSSASMGKESRPQRSSAGRTLAAVTRSPSSEKNSTKQPCTTEPEPASTPASGPQNYCG